MLNSKSNSRSSSFPIPNYHSSKPLKMKGGETSPSESGLSLESYPISSGESDGSIVLEDLDNGEPKQNAANHDVKGDGEKFDDPFPDFQWMTTEEPHRSRRMAILKAHPEVRKLMGPTPYTLPLVLAVLTTQILLAINLRHLPTFSPTVLLIAYIIGGTLNQNTFLAIHEITHNLAFKSIKANKVLAIVANFAIGVPYAMAFKGYHIEHHKFLGVEGIDTDLPSRFEALVLNNVAGKTFFATFQLLFYAIRPGFIRTQKPTKWHLLNFIAVLSFDAILVNLYGWKPLVYLILSSFFAGSLHPCAAHFIAEHYLMNEVSEDAESEDILTLGQETTSYYGWLNILCYNVGYHNEHHDFPSVAWTNLPALRRLAHEFYDPLPSHKSWPYVTYKFITDPSVGMWSRVVRVEKGTKIEERVWKELARSCGAHVGEGRDDDSSEESGPCSEEEEEERAYMSDRDVKAPGKGKME